MAVYRISGGGGTSKKKFKETQKEGSEETKQIMSAQLLHKFRLKDLVLLVDFVKIFSKMIHKFLKFPSPPLHTVMCKSENIKCL